ncbi:DUF5908 family protein [Ascidiimonas sp. W6]|uniref:DUF5908 family protein n=1 Tax=Ascidiimonas meishanensis TaxID=3128903 RepID=UPI0030EC8D25
MAVEIKEIVIRAVLTDEEASGKSSEGSTFEKENLVEECVHQVLKILDKKNRR